MSDTEFDLGKVHATLDPVERLRTSAYLNQGYARGVDLGSLEQDEAKSADFYRGKAEAFTEAAELIAALGLTLEWSDDLAGPDWQRYSRWVGKTTDHPGPKRLAAGLT